MRAGAKNRDYYAVMTRPPTLEDIIRNDGTVTTWCEACQTRGDDFDPTALARRFGAHRILKSLDKRFRCTRCGVKGKVTTQVQPGTKEYRR